MRALWRGFLGPEARWSHNCLHPQTVAVMLLTSAPGPGGISQAAASPTGPPGCRPRADREPGVRLSLVGPASPPPPPAHRPATERISWSGPAGKHPRPRAWPPPVPSRTHPACWRHSGRGLCQPRWLHLKPLASLRQKISVKQAPRSLPQGPHVWHQKPECQDRARRWALGERPVR